MNWLEPVTTAARLAGQVALRYYRADIAVEAKQDGSPVTVADRSAEAAARAWIAAHFPDDAVVGEESGISGPPNAARKWVIDPVDGTHSFVRGVPFWGTMIGVLQGESVLAGAVFCPALDEMVAAAPNEGCWFNAARCQVSQVATLEQATILTSDDRFSDRPSRQQRWNDLAQRVSLARTWGDCYGYLMVATGRAEVMVDNRLSIWDYAPLVPIVSEAGGVISDWRGRAAFGGDAIATNAALAHQVRSLLCD
jgi:histidinol phosphatase-like enzyme (inositol monophosphatase family)